MIFKDLFRFDNWKNKAKQRAKEINALKKRNKEILESRDKIKSKNIKLTSQNEELETKNKQLELELKKN